MIVATMTIREVAQTKGVSESGVRFAVHDPKNRSLLGVKCGGRLLILASSVAGYVPRNYPRMEKLRPHANAQQRRILGILETLASEMVGEHPDAARILRASYPGPVAQNGRPGYSLGFYRDDVAPDGLRMVARDGSADMIVMFNSDDEPTIREKARTWAIMLLEEAWVEAGSKG